ncbi:hypothetical protein HDU97_000634 [Phlyctochytrium planicorne]|nr:hypothetical protein HDU97_000634 [Phlyctochytrium planicorne]
MEPQSRLVNLRTIIFDIIAAFTAQETKLVMIIDDFQWVDNMSIDVMIDVAKSCKNSFLLLLSRPNEEYRLEAVPHLLKSCKDDVIHLQLKGLEPNEILQFMQWKLKEKHSAVSNEIFQKIVNSTEGLPFFVEVLLDNIHAQIEAQDTLKPFIEVDSIDIKNTSAMILVQFDTLETSFKDFLRLVSVFGQLNESPEDLAAWIEISDRYRFLTYSTTMTGVEEHYDSPSFGQRLYAFKNNSIVNCIYDSQPFDGRRKIHENIGGMFETLLVDNNRDLVLPIIVHHFTQSGNFRKALPYLEELGNLYNEKFLVDSCIRTVLALIAMAEKGAETDAIGVSKKDIELRKARWHCVLAFSYSLKKDLASSWKFAHQALQILNEPPWPKTSKELNYKTFLEFSLHLKLWMATNGGRREHLKTERRANGTHGFSITAPRLLPPLRSFNSLESAHFFESDSIKATMYNLVRETCVWDSSQQPQSQVLALIKSMNICIRYARKSPSAFANLCVKGLLTFRAKSPFLHKMYRRREISIVSSMDQISQSQFENQYLITALYDYVDGKVDQGLCLVQKYIANRKNDGDYNNQYVGLCLRGHFEFWRGSGKPEVIADIQFYSHESFKVSSAYLVITANAILGREFVLRGDFQAVEPLTLHIGSLSRSLSGTYFQANFLCFMLTVSLFCEQQRSIPLGYFVELVQGMQNVDTIFSGSVDAVISIPMFALLIMFPPPLASGMPSKLSVDELQKFKASLLLLRSLTRRIATKFHIRLCHYSSLLGNAILESLKHGHSKAAVMRLKQVISRKNKHLGVFKLFRSLLMASIVLLGGPKGNQQYLVEALGVFENVGYFTLVKWLKSWTSE